jgi:hypothetical protein
MVVMQTTSPVRAKIMSGALAVSLLSGLTGCESSMTYKLWTNGEFRRYYEPAPNPRLQLFHDVNQGDVLAAYDEAHETRSAIRRRAYYVNHNRLRLEAGQKPHFVSADRAVGLKPVTFIEESTTLSLPGSETIQAVLATNGQRFTLSGDFGGHTYQLPVYQDQSGLVGRIVLTPFAVAGDVVVVGAVVAVVAALAWAHTGFAGLTN